MFPRCGIPDAYGSWRSWEDYVSFLYRTGSITDFPPDSGGASARISRIRRSRSGSPTGQPDLAESQSLAALCYALAVRCARAHDDAEPLPILPIACSRRTSGGGLPLGFVVLVLAPPLNSAAANSVARSRRRFGSRTSD